MAPAAANDEAVDVARSRQTASAAQRLKARKVRVIHARLAASELAAVKDAAERAGMTMSAFIRSLALDGAGVSPFLTEEDRVVFDLLHRELRAIGANLNSLVRLAHERTVPIEITNVLQDLRPVVVGVVLELRRLAGRKVAERH